MQRLLDLLGARWRRLFAAVLFGVVLLYAAIEVRLLASRVAYPWDILTCFETSFLNGMLKFHNGQSLYSAPEEANSEVYPPGVHYLIYGLLHPFHRELDIRFCRFTAVLISLALAGLVAELLMGMLRSAGPPGRWPSWWYVFFFLAAFLMVHKNMTSDAPHPDNLHALHAVGALLLCWLALTREDFSMALAATVWAGLGIWTKQTALLSPIAAALALLLGRRWGARRSAALAVVGVAVAGALVLLLHRGFGGYHLFRAMANHRLVDITIFLGSPFLDGGKLSPLIFPPRLALLFLAPAAAIWLATEPSRRKFVLVWAAFGVFEVAPAFVALLKEGGNFNNLGIIDLWLFILVFPAALDAHRRLGETRAAPAVQALVAALLLFLTLGLYPLKMRPRADAWRFGETVEKSIAADVRAGKRLWVPTGAMFLIRAGQTTPLQDLSINLWTADQSDYHDLLISQRLREKKFDAIYYIFPWKLSLLDQIKENYALARHVAGPVYGDHKDQRGIQPYLTYGCDVFEPKPLDARR